jgi:DNA repair protein RadC
MKSDNHFPINNCNEEDRPREKLLMKGKAHLRDAELLAIIIGSGTQKLSAVQLSEQILNHVNKDLNLLYRLSIQDLQKFKGIGEAKAISIVSAMELGRRRATESIEKVSIIKSSKDSYHLLMPHLSDLPLEEFWVIYLNNRNKVLGKEQLSTGGLTGTVVDIRIVLKRALERMATGIVLAHNHPSGNLNPSQSDIKLTDKLTQAAKLIEIQVLDHVIITESGYFSFADEGMM